MNEIEFLEKCAIIKVEYEEKQKEEGTLFNVFSILGLSSREVRLHSTMISELLNPGGTHTMGDLFLNEFIKLLKNEAESKFVESKFTKQVEDFLSDTKSSIVKVEENIGEINEEKTKGGRIDIFIDNRGKHIIIENKIYANDQPNQLLRYRNFSRDALILYLTLTGKPSNEKDSGSFPISYEKFITKWLDKCIEITKEKCNDKKQHKIVQTIQQYKDIITNYLIPSNQNEMTDDIKKLIRSNENIFKAIPEINGVYEQLKQEIKDIFWKEVWNTEWGSYDENVIYKFKKNGFELRSRIEDNGGFFYGFHIEQKNDIFLKLFYEKLQFQSKHIKFGYSNWGLIYNSGNVETQYYDFFERFDWAFKMENKQERDKYINDILKPNFNEVKELVIKVAKEIDNQN